MNELLRLWNRFCALRFVLVGVWNTAFSYLVFAVLYHFFGGGWGDVLVQGVSAVIGITNAYICHRILTYRSQGVWWKEYLRFYVVYGTQTALQAGCFFVFATWLGMSGYVVQLVLVLIFTVLSYWAHKCYSFKT